MLFEIKTRNSADRRKWDLKQTENRLDVVKALDAPFSPKKANEMEPGRWYAIQKDVHVRVIK